jgi:hypothetical protein
VDCKFVYYNERFDKYIWETPQGSLFCGVFCNERGITLSYTQEEINNGVKEYERTVGSFCCHYV